MIGEAARVTEREVTIYPVIMGPPTLDHGAERTRSTAGSGRRCKAVCEAVFESYGDGSNPYRLGAPTHDPCELCATATFTQALHSQIARALCCCAVQAVAPRNRGRRLFLECFVTRRIYPNPPIVEAVIEFRFEESGPGAELSDVIRTALSATYDAEETATQDRIEAEVSLTGGGVAAAARRTPHITFLRSASGHRLLGCGPGSLSVHVLAPYPGWESFIGQAEEAVGALPAPVADSPVLVLSIRYIDRIEIPGGRGGFADYLSVLPPRPKGMPAVLAGCHYVTHATDPRDGTRAQLTVASTPGEPEKGPALLYDLALQQSGQPLCSFQVDSWRPLVEEMHARQREIFEQSITDRTRELFQ